MSSQTPLEAVIKVLKADTALCNMLNGGANGIFVVGRPTNATLRPFLTVGDMSETGGGWTDFYLAGIRIRVFFGERDGTSHVGHGFIIQRLKILLNRADLGQVSGGFMDCYWSGYVSEDRFDFNLGMFYKEVRFSVAMTENITP